MWEGRHLNKKEKGKGKLKNFHIQYVVLLSK